MAKNGLRKWVKDKWVDIGAPKKGGGFKPCGRSKGEKRSGYPKCVPASKAASMTDSQRKSAVRRRHNFYCKCIFKCHKNTIYSGAR